MLREPEAENLVIIFSFFYFKFSIFFICINLGFMQIKGNSSRVSPVMTPYCAHTCGGDLCVGCGTLKGMPRVINLRVLLKFIGYNLCISKVCY